MHPPLHLLTHGYCQEVRQRAYLKVLAELEELSRTEQPSTFADYRESEQVPQRPPGCKVLGSLQRAEVGPGQVPARREEDQKVRPCLDPGLHSSCGWPQQHDTSLLATGQQTWSKHDKRGSGSSRGGLKVTQRLIPYDCLWSAGLRVP